MAWGQSLPALAPGTVNDTAESNLGVSSSGITTSTVQNLNLLSGLVSASLIKAQTNLLGLPIGLDVIISDANQQSVGFQLP